MSKCDTCDKELPYQNKYLRFCLECANSIVHACLDNGLLTERHMLIMRNSALEIIKDESHVAR